MHTQKTMRVLVLSKKSTSSLFKQRISQPEIKKRREKRNKNEQWFDEDKKERRETNERESESEKETSG